MHETSLVRSLLRQVGELLVKHGGSCVETIRVEIGPLSGVERLLVESAFSQIVESTACRGADLVVEEIPLAAVCRECTAEFEVEQFRFLCPCCDSGRVRITGGDQFRLLDVTIETPDSSQLERPDSAHHHVRT